MCIKSNIFADALSGNLRLKLIYLENESRTFSSPNRKEYLRLSAVTSPKCTAKARANTFVLGSDMLTNQLTGTDLVHKVLGYQIQFFLLKLFSYIQQVKRIMINWEFSRFGQFCEFMIQFHKATLRVS